MKYRIDLVQTVVESATVEVEADSREAAEQEALDIATNGVTARLAIDWHFIEVEQDAQILLVEEVKPRPNIIDLYKALKATEQT